MREIKPCNPYHAVACGRELLRLADAKSVFKVYFINIIGRADPSRTVWAERGEERALYLKALAAAEGVEGIGFVTAFPHITKVFRFSPQAETVLNVRAWNTRGLTPLPLERDDDYLEFACLAEAVIAADEYRLWAQAETVAAYLEEWGAFADGLVTSHEKLRTYWEQG